MTWPFPGFNTSAIDNIYVYSLSVQNKTKQKTTEWLWAQPGSELFAHSWNKGLSHVPLFATSRTIALQAPLSMRFSRQEYQSWLLFPSPGDLPDPRTESMSPELAGGFSITEPPRKPLQHYYPISRVHSHPPFQAIFCTVANLFSY